MDVTAETESDSSDAGSGNGEADHRTGQRVQVSLSRKLGLFDVTMIGVAAMIGAGIFGLTRIAAGDTSAVGLLLAFLFDGLLTSLAGLTYAELFRKFFVELLEMVGLHPGTEVFAFGLTSVQIWVKIFATLSALLFILINVRGSSDVTIAALQQDSGLPN